MNGRALVTGWFSFKDMGATAGDLIARDVAVEWLHDAGYQVDVANDPAFPGGIDLDRARPDDYTHLVFVCGPIGNGWPIPDLLDRFQHCETVGLNLSMLEPLDVWNPFDILFERDSSVRARPDVTFAAAPRQVPVLGTILVHPQGEYVDGRHDAVGAAIDGLIRRHDVAAVPIDTRLDNNATGLQSAGAVEALVGRMDAVVTTRLHGMVLALKQGVPALVIDPIPGGAKVTRQAAVLGWPVISASESADPTALDIGLSYCLSSEAWGAALRCRAAARVEVDRVRAAFIDRMTQHGPG
jgi:hypothetical protein